MSDSIERFWASILSREPELIRNALSALDENSRTSVINHLRRMVDEPGWNPEQRTSAKAALDVIHG